MPRCWQTQQLLQHPSYKLCLRRRLSRSQKLTHLAPVLGHEGQDVLVVPEEQGAFCHLHMVLPVSLQVGWGISIRQLCNALLKARALAASAASTVRQLQQLQKTGCISRSPILSKATGTGARVSDGPMHDGRGLRLLPGSGSCSGTALFV